jgi:phosphoribosyl-AMP cyclohydrolase / phosphoribosyl-ATP pyrophosphohydrolase
MIIPSIDLAGGQAVQLIGGRELALEAGDPRPLARQFGVVGEVAVIDLDAALGRGENGRLIEELCTIASCRVGGGIRSVEAAKSWLDRGAEKVILGTAARLEVLRELPKERVIAALDARDGEVVVEGWTKGTGKGILEQVATLAPYVGGFLVTFVELEGRLGGTSLDRVAAIVEAAGEAQVTIAGGITTGKEIAVLDRAKADAQVGMAIYTGKLSLAEAFTAPLLSDRPDGLIATVVCDPRDVALGLAWSNRESLAQAIDRRQGIYHSRRRGLWVKGESSGATQTLLQVAPDCDRDAVRFTVTQAEPGFCHNDTWTCFGPERGLGQLERTLMERLREAPSGSYTARLVEDPRLLTAKLIEEAQELAEAASPEHIAEESADLLYLTMVAMARAGVQLADVERVLDRRARKVTRRPGNAKVDLARFGPGKGE